ncbi:hypothetical protein [Ralstonia sp. GP71]
MSARNAIRQFHRWVSMAFTLTVIANFVAMGVGKGRSRLRGSPMRRCCR